MRLFQHCMTSILLLLSLNHIIAQNNCGDTLPAISCPMDNIVCIDEIVTTTLSASSNLPNVEYAIIDDNTLATSGAGPAVVGFDLDGTFIPTDFNLTAGGSFSVIPLAYDLSQIQETIDDILFGSVVIIIFNTSCCALAIQSGTDICATLNNAGIFSGADVTSLADASALFGAGNSLFTIQELAANLEGVNIQLSDPNLPVQCGGGDVFCYAYGNQCTYTILPSTISSTSLVLNTTHVMDETIAATGFINSSSTVQNPNDVEYYASMCVELTPDFETIIGSEFLADIDNLCN